MAVVDVSKFFYLKSRPKAYKSDGMTIGGNKGSVLAAYPKDYKETSQQKKVRTSATACGIKSGIGRKSLREKMKYCVGPVMRDEMTIEEAKTKYGGA